MISQEPRLASSPWLDSVQINMSAKFDTDIPCGSRTFSLTDQPD